MRIVLNIFICALALCICSCSKEAAVEYTTALETVVSIEESAVASKAEILGTEFPDNGTFGLFICKGGSYEEFSGKSNNIKACFFENENKWYYQYDGYSNWFSSLIFKCTSEKKFVDVYAYSPFVAGVSDLSNIPFDLKDQPDLMYARQNSNPDVNKGIDMTDEDQDKRSAYLTFAHALSLVELSVKLKRSGSQVRVERFFITTTSAESSTKLRDKGVFNALTGEITCDENSSNVISRNAAVDYSRTQNIYSDRRISFYLLVPPVTVEDDDVVIGIVMEGVGGVDSDVNQLTIPKEHLMHSDGTYGFRAGYKYTLELDVDNYLHLSGVGIDNDWTEKTYKKDI